MEFWVEYRIKEFRQYSFPKIINLSCCSHFSWCCTSFLVPFHTPYALFTSYQEHFEKGISCRFQSQWFIYVSILPSLSSIDLMVNLYPTSGYVTFYRLIETTTSKSDLISVQIYGNPHQHWWKNYFTSSDPHHGIKSKYPETTMM